MIRTQGLVAAFKGAAPIVFPDVWVPQGGTLLLRGPSGSGKSTWLAVAAGLLAPLAGQMEVADTPLTMRGAALDAWRARHVGFLPQRLHLSPALTVSQNLALVYWAAGLPPDAARMQATLQALGVVDLAHRLPLTLSGGQAQRVALARAVLLSPRVLLADEPTASLDDEAAHAALALLQQTAAANGATLVLATHDARAVQAVQDLTTCQPTASPGSHAQVNVTDLVLQRMK